MEIPKDFGARVRAARAYKNMTREELGTELGVSAGFLKGVEGGNRPDPIKARGLVERLPEVTDLPEQFFLGRVGNGTAEELAALRDLVETLRVETAAHALEVMQRLDEGFGQGLGSQ